MVSLAFSSSSWLLFSLLLRIVSLQRLSKPSNLLTLGGKKTLIQNFLIYITSYQFQQTINNLISQELDLTKQQLCICLQCIIYMNHQSETCNCLLNARPYLTYFRRTFYYNTISHYPLGTPYLFSELLYITLIFLTAPCLGLSYRGLLGGLFTLQLFLQFCWNFLSLLQ